MESAAGVALADCGTVGTAAADARLYALAPTLVDALRVAVEQRDEAREALATCHRAAGRGEGHRTPAETARCVVSALTTLRIDLGTAEREAEERGRLAGVEEERARVVAWLRAESEDAADSARQWAYESDHVALKGTASDIESGAHAAKEEA